MKKRHCLQVLNDLAKDYDENNNAPVPIMYTDEIVYVMDQA